MNFVFKVLSSSEIIKAALLKTVTNSSPSSSFTSSPNFFFEFCKCGFYRFIKLLHNIHYLNSLPVFVSLIFTRSISSKPAKRIMNFKIFYQFRSPPFGFAFLSDYVLCSGVSCGISIPFTVVIWIVHLCHLSFICFIKCFRKSGRCHCSKFSIRFRLVKM